MNLLSAIREVWNEMRSPSEPKKPPKQAESLTPPQSPAGALNADEERELQRVPLIPFRTLAKFSEVRPDVLHTYTHKRLTTAIENDWERIPFVRFEGTGQAAWYTWEYYEVALDDVKKHYLETEQYELIPHLEELRQKHRINAVLRQSRLR